MPKHNVDAASAPSAVSNVVERLGANIQTARLRRRWTVEDLAGKAGISKETLSRAEAGRLTTGIGAYAAILWALGLHDQVGEIAAPESDAEGEALAAARLGSRVRHRATLSDDF